MGKVLELKAKPSYNPTTQAKLGLYAAMLDDQLNLLKEDIAHLDVVHLEWQQQPGMNTIGMLLTHCAIVEVYWLYAADQENMTDEEMETVFKNMLGVGGDDDGMPAKAETRHPAILRGKTTQDYFTMLDKARTATHELFQGWTDAKLDSVYSQPKRDRNFSYNWTIYHILEHFSGHYGQVLLLMHLMQDAGVLAKPEKK